MTPRPKITETVTLPRASYYNTIYPFTECNTNGDEEYDAFYREEFIDSDDDYSRRRTIKKVLHTKRFVYNIPVPHAITFGGYEWRYTYFSTSLVQLPEGSRPRVNFQPDIDTLIRAAQDQFISDFSAILLLLEPLDLRKLLNPKKFKAYIGDKEFVQDYNPGFDLSSPESAVLSTNLSVAPFISDMGAIRDRLWNWTKILDRFASRLKKGIRKSTSRTFNASGTVFISDDYMVEYSSTLKKVWGIRVTGDVSSSLKGALSRYNFRVDLGTVWQFLPFSFLIDYFVPIGAALDKGTYIENMKVSQSWTSEKLKVFCVHYRKVSPGVRYVLDETGYRYYPETLPSDWKKVGTTEYSEFYRTPEQFDTSDGIVVKPLRMPNPFSRQGANISALLSQAVRSR